MARSHQLIPQITVAIRTRNRLRTDDGNILCLNTPAGRNPMFGLHVNLSLFKPGCGEKPAEQEHQDDSPDTKEYPFPVLVKPGSDSTSAAWPITYPNPTGACYHSDAKGVVNACSTASATRTKTASCSLLGKLTTGREG